MKKLSLLVLSVMFFAIGNVKAQKFGHVRIDSLLLSMPEYKSAKEKGDAKLKSLQTFLSNLQNEYDQKLQKAQNDAANMSEIERKNVEEELMGMQQRIQTRNVEAQNELQVYEGALMKPINEKVRKAIEKVAKDNSFKYIFDTTAGTIPYCDPADDVYKLVKKELDAMPAVKLPDSAGSDINKGAGNGKTKTGGK